MHIKYIKIKNFRGIDIELDNLKSDFLIIGKNDSGKSNLCHAINKVLNYSVRKIPLEDSDSTNYNKENIEISIYFDFSKINPVNYSEIAKYVEQDEKILCVNYIGEYDQTISNYKEKIIFGQNDEFSFPASYSNPLDKILSFTYINANYNLEKSKKSFFKYTNDDDLIKVDVTKQIKDLNEIINSDSDVAKLNRDLNKTNFKEIFDDIRFEISSNIDVSNLYKSLDVIPKLIIEQNKNNSLKNIGDGKSKVLSLVLEYIKSNKDKENIFIIEEPENNMYPIMQRRFSQVISSLGLDQVIYTTHSPYIIDLKKTDQIIKLSPNSEKKFFSLNIKKSDFEELGEKIFPEFTEMFFYDKVILVEGWTEKYFYNQLEREDDNFSKYLYDTNAGVFCVYGIGFHRIKNMLENLGINVIIKTDNDIYKVSRKQLKQYAGIKRVLECLPEDKKQKIKTILGKQDYHEELKELFNFSIEKNVDQNIEENMKQILAIFKENSVIISENHDGFEGDFYDFIINCNFDESIVSKTDFIKISKDAKLKNLHSFIVKNGIKLKINNENITNSLVNFIEEKWIK